MKFEIKDLTITLTEKDTKILPSIINDLTKESKMFILILASIIIPAYTYLKTHKNYIEVNDVKNDKTLNEGVIDNE
jgi:hypothetical protein